MPATREDFARLGLADPQTGQPLDPLAQPVQDPERPLGTVDDWNTASEDRALEAERRFTEPGQQPNQWDSEENPYKKEADTLRQQTQANTPNPSQQLDAAREQNRRWAAEAWDMAVARNMDPGVARAVIESKMNELNAQAELEVHRTAALPLVRRGAADDIAAQFSDKKLGVVINPDELAGEQSMEGMRARAKTLAEVRKKSAQDTRYETRQRTAVDRAESGPVATGKSRVPENISPVRRIAYGVERGHL